MRLQTMVDQLEIIDRKSMTVLKPRFTALTDFPETYFSQINLVNYHLTVVLFSRKIIL